MLVFVDFPELAGRTGGFRRGAPHDAVVGADAARVVFRRSAGRFDDGDGLWTLDVATGAEVRVAEGPVGAFGIDRNARVAAYAAGDRLYRVDLVKGETRE